MSLLHDPSPMPTEPAGFTPDAVMVTRTVDDLLHRRRQNKPVADDLLALTWRRPGAAAQITTETARQLHEAHKTITKLRTQLRKLGVKT